MGRIARLKDSAFSFLAFHGDFAALDFGQFLHQSQPDADSLIFAAGGVIRLPEAVEYVRQIFRRDPHARVFNHQNQFLAPWDTLIGQS